MTSGLVGLRSQQPRPGNSGWQNFCRRAINVQSIFCHCTGGLRKRIFSSSEMHGLTQSCSGTVLAQKDFMITSGIYIFRSLSFQFGLPNMRTSQITRPVSFFLTKQFPVAAYLMIHVLIRGLGFYESNHQLPGFIGLDWTLCVVRFLRELSDSIGVQCSTLILSSHSDLRTMSITVNRLSYLINLSQTFCRHAWGRWQSQWSWSALHWSWYHPYISKKLRNKPSIPDHQSLWPARPTSHHIMAEGDQWFHLESGIPVYISPFEHRCLVLCGLVLETLHLVKVSS